MVLRGSLTAALSFGLLLVGDARAGMCLGYFRVSVPGPEMARNGVVLIDSSLDRSEMEKALPNAKFVSGKSTFAAKVVRKLDGGRFQALIAPVSDLPASTSFHLAVGVTEIDEYLAKFELKTGATRDETAPKWTKAPSVGKRTIEPSNKGDSVDEYAVRVPLEAPAFVLAKIVYGKDTAYVLQPARKDEIAIGTTGCASMWRAGNASGAVRVELTAISPSGQETAAPGKPLVLFFP